MPLTIIYPTWKINMPRSYMKGFVGSADVSNMHYSGETLVFEYLAPAYRVDLVIQHKFFVPSSNVYSIDHVFDAAASQGYLFGSPFAATINVAFYPMTTEATWRIRVLSVLAPLESQKLDLAPLTGYWRPI